MPRPCPLCGAEPGASRWPDMHGRLLLRCPACHLLYADTADLPVPDRERARYLLHRNTPGDAGYVRFLRRLWNPLRALLPNPFPPDAALLDFGSGPAPVLAGLVRADGFSCDTYDPFFAPEPPPRTPYAAILACEVVEHFHHPLESWRTMRRLLAPGGFLAVMTSPPPPSPADFARWSYAGDFTHVAFYASETLRHIGAVLGLALMPSAAPEVSIFQCLPCRPQDG